MKSEQQKAYGEAAQSIAPYGFAMAFFTLLYSLFFGFAWGLIGWFMFGLVAVCSVYIACISLKNMKHANRFEVYESLEGQRIKKQMGLLSAVTYTGVWLCVLVLAFLDLRPFIFPAVTLIIGLHFIPQAKIMNRVIDYFVAPFPILSALLAIYLGIVSDMHWYVLWSVSGIGGAGATLVYGFYLLSVYRKTAEKFGVPYK
ncbi:hypothetical protein DDV21_003400 [Streptococcus chenjunshii]|uniref:Uncharacterized protein n=1 Tax=Streptococcus chenjunshii TaxID=2173853 RepID=A0A372KPC0_9STRE|nr:hypothetical protein [Streptococcus chenjunshii]AXQ78188.1 hypothetical protein DDV21_003400 [Streptococcus chenjunshii]RFU50941.1 hypothetical protein DDV22_06110 [Streptococcus chenjunshii]RFU53438.1 hypothetical protein DDV23_04365 [Streptococcus chenjunshii]